MFQLLLQKFDVAKYRTLLLNTNNDYIEETNWWGDKYWGVCHKTGEGQNILGQLLMNVRKIIEYL